MKWLLIRFLALLAMAADLSELAGLRDAITTKVQSIAAFSGVSVLSRKTGNLASVIERDLAKLKLVVIVILPQAVPHLRQSQRPILDPVKFRLRIVEDVLLNKTGKSACYLAERGLAGLQWWTPGVPGAHMIKPVEPGILELAIIGKPDQDADEDFAGFDVFFETKLALAPNDETGAPLRNESDEILRNG